jgi:hypothetical protein
MITDEIRSAIIACARGSYQENLLRGREAWSGSTLRGTARSYGAHYWRSRKHLLERISRALPEGWSCDTDLELIDSRWTRRLILISPEGQWIDWLRETVIPPSQRKDCRRVHGGPFFVRKAG